MSYPGLHPSLQNFVSEIDLVTKSISEKLVGSLNNTRLKKKKVRVKILN